MSTAISHHVMIGRFCDAETCVGQTQYGIKILNNFWTATKRDYFLGLNLAVPLL